MSATAPGHTKSASRFRAVREGGPARLSAAAALLALAGETVIALTAWKAIGGALVLAGMALMIAVAVREAAPPDPVSQEPSRRQAALLLLGILIVAFLMRRVQIGAIPWGLNNDEGIEGLIACRFLAGEAITPFSSIGLSRETLFHLLLMPLFSVAGPGIASLRMLSFLCGMAGVLLAYVAGSEMFSRRTGLVASFLMAVSSWHLLYSRTGLRNILLPVFFLGALWGFHRALRERRLLFFALTGVFLAAGMNSYTSFRVVPLALLAWLAVRRWLLKRPPLRAKEIAAGTVPFVVLMVPQLLVAARDPAGFLARGSYVLAQTPDASIPANLLYSFLMPGFYPARFGVMQSRWFFGDGVSLVYAAVGRAPETAVAAALMALGMVAVAARFVRRRGEGEGMVLLLYAATVAGVGLAGPSLTRLIGLVPLLCFMAAIGLEEITLRCFGSRPALRLAVTAGILALAAGASVEQYFLRAGRSPKAMFYYAAPQTIIGLYAASRAPDHPVHVFASEQPEALRFLTFTRQQFVVLHDDPATLDMTRVRRALGRQEFVLENHRKFYPLFTSLAQEFPWAEGTVLKDAQGRFDAPVAYIVSVDPARKEGAPAAPGPGSPRPPTMGPDGAVPPS